MVILRRLFKDRKNYLGLLERHCSNYCSEYGDWLCVGELFYIKMYAKREHVYIYEL